MRPEGSRDCIVKKAEAGASSHRESHTHPQALHLNEVLVQLLTALAALHRHNKDPFDDQVTTLEGGE